ncbi:hypothetical protein HPB52_011925 [Rhipicephalus sanguineus]|uniref:Peptidase M13 N-terminal domain-containing protein n=1 Tax=Rhipicephalus sanguineus TaxID=34632 RepID=A0A9D4T057_RHISA|nr:hypothetical protein HPB52_011925 [Rhipicephalus sanguineus]
MKSLLGASGKSACENFYEYVCGSWAQAHSLYSTSGAGASISSDTIIQERLDKELASLLGSSNADDLRVAAALYQACMDRKKADAATNDVKELFKTWKIREWPRDSNGTMKEAWNFAGELVRDLGLSVILDAVLAVGSQYSDHVIVELREPTRIFSCSGPSRPAVMSLFRAALREVVEEFTQAPKAEILEEITHAFTRLGSSFACSSVVDFGGTKFTEPSAAAVKLSELDADITHFLTTTFNGATKFEPTTLVVLRQPMYLLDKLALVIRALSSRALMNYMGFLALAHLSAFLPERHVHLRQLFAKEMRGRILPDVSNSTAICAMAVEHILPACFNKLSSAVFRHAEYDARVPEKMSQLEDAFARNIGHLAWMSDELIVINRYRIKHRRASQLGPSMNFNGNDSCAPSDMSWRTDSPVEFYRAVSRAQHHVTFQRIVAGGVASSDTPLRPSSVHATYDHLMGRVQVPTALFNTSVPGNSAGFSLQLARYAVRFYSALLEALFVDERGQLGPDDASRRRLETLLQCFEWDLRELPTALRSPVAPDPAVSRGAILQQTAALQLAFRAFQELWQTPARLKSRDKLVEVRVALSNVADPPRERPYKPSASQHSRASGQPPNRGIASGSRRYGSHRFHSSIAAVKDELHQAFWNTLSPDSAAPAPTEYYREKTYAEALKRPAASPPLFFGAPPTVSLQSAQPVPYYEDRYQRLPDLSAEALFFVYYALDNCENSDQVYKEQHGRWLPAEYRVNLPLRHLVEFAPLFNCSADTNMGQMGLGRTCAVVTPDTWMTRAPAAS